MHSPTNFASWLKSWTVVHRRGGQRRRGNCEPSGWVAVEVARLENRELLSGANELTPLPAADCAVSAGAAALLEAGPRGVPTAGAGSSAAFESTAGDPDAPALSTTVEGINFDENGTNNGGSLSIPPDPHGAAGLNHLVSIVNRSIEWHTKSGTQQNSQSLSSFFSSLSPVSPFDPKVVYDHFQDRFIVLSLDKTTSPSNASRILVAVSDDGDPNGTWRFQAINSQMTINSLDCWADYPGLAIDEEAIYITSNMFSFSTGVFQASRLWIADKTNLYAGTGSSTFTVYDPSTLSGEPGQSFTLQPALMMGAGAGSTGTFLVSSSWSSGATEYMAVIRVDNPLSSPTFNNQFISLGDISNGSVPGATQSGTASTIDAGDTRVMNAVWRNNSLYTAHTINPTSGTDSGQATAHWTRFSTATLAAITRADQGNIGGEELGSSTHTFYPTIAVDAQSNVAVGFAASNPSIFAGAYYTGRLSGAAAGTMQTVSTLAAGTDWYFRTFSGTRNRWGDYSATVVAPDGNFWVFNEYAMTRGTITNGTQDGRWATRWGSFSMNANPVLATNTGLTLNEAGTATIGTSKLQVTDTDNTTAQLIYTLTAVPASGQLKKGGTALGLSETFTQADIDANSITYVHDGGETTSDSFKFTVSDGSGGSIPETTFAIAVTPQDDSPVVANNTGLTLNEAATATVDNAKLAVTDPDNSASQLIYTLTAVPASGQLKKGGTALGLSETFTQADIDANSITYVHDGGETTSDSFKFTVSDGSGGSIPETTFAIAVTPQNDAPVLATNTGLTLNEAGTATIGTSKLQVTDTDNTTAQLIYTLTAIPANGQLKKSGTALGLSGTFTQADIDANSMTYVHDGGETTSDSFKFTVRDGSGGSIPETTFAIAVTPQNDSPVVATNTGLTLNEAATATVDNTKLAVSDPDNSASQLIYTLTAVPASGQLKKGGTPLGLSGTFMQADIDANSITYVHDGSETTSDSFKFTVSDGSGGSIAETTFAIAVTPQDDSPVVATNTGLTLNEAATATVDNAKLAVTDPDNSASQLIYTLTAVPANGQLKKGGTALGLSETFTQADIDANSITYVHDGSESTSDSFKFTVTDGAGGNVPETTFAITVTPVADDIVLNSVAADGFTTLTVVYQISGGAQGAFRLGAYRSADASFGGDTLVGSASISDPADLADGPHSKTFAIGTDINLPGAGASDPASDYRLLFVLDDLDAVAEADADPFNEDNTAAFQGAYHQSLSAVMAFGSDSSDTFTAVVSGTDFQFTQTGNPLRTYAQSDATSFRIRGAGSADTLTAGTIAKPFFVWGGDGNDTLTSGTSNDSLDGGLGNDSLVANGGNDTVHGQAGNDTLNGGGGNDSLLGEAGDDSLTGAAGNDKLLGGADNDTYVFAAATTLESDTATELPGEGTDTLTFSGLAATVGVTVDLSTAGTTLATHTNRTLLAAAAGQAANWENVTGGAGNDLLTGNAAANTLTGNAGNDALNGGAGSDSLVGGTGDDMYSFDTAVGSETDTVKELGSQGTDTLSFASLSATDPVTANLTTSGTTLATLTGRTVVASATGQAANWENLTGGAGNDSLTGNAAANVLTGNGGNDTLTGKAANDTAIGGLGDDSYVFAAAVGSESDTVAELTGEGTDTLNFSGLTATDPVTVDLSTAGATLGSHTGRTLLAAATGQAANWEKVTGGAGNDVLTGNALANTLTGNAGNDNLNGLDGNDALVGNAGNDTLAGGTGNDTYTFAAAVGSETDTVTELANEGTDTLNFTSLTAGVGVVVDLSNTLTTTLATHAGRTVVASAVGQAANWENVTGGAGNDTLTGNGLKNVLTGNGGNDTLVGLDGNDTLKGGDNDDSLDGGNGTDNLDGGAGTDTGVNGETVSNIP